MIKEQYPIFLVEWWVRIKTKEIRLLGNQICLLRSKQSFTNVNYLSRYFGDGCKVFLIIFTWFCGPNHQKPNLPYQIFCLPFPYFPQLFPLQIWQKYKQRRSNSAEKQKKSPKNRLLENHNVLNQRQIQMFQCNFHKTKLNLPSNQFLLSKSAVCLQFHEAVNPLVWCTCEKCADKVGDLLWECWSNSILSFIQDQSIFLMAAIRVSIFFDFCNVISKIFLRYISLNIIDKITAVCIVNQLSSSLFKWNLGNHYKWHDN